MGFKKDLEFGRSGEKIVCDALMELGLEPVLNDQPRKLFYDISFEWKNQIITGEVKYDAYFAKSGNLAFEISNPKTGKPSGLYKTTADLWFHVVPGDVIYWANTNVLRIFTEAIKPDKHVKKGGDGNAELKLYKLENAKKVLVEWDMFKEFLK